ncbi:MAG: FadR/GntR family transcriptional regulator [Acidimicrobiia bacterium]
MTDPGDRRRITIPKAAAMVCSDLRARILSGELKEGTALPNEGQLMEIYGVSRPTIRESVRMLEAERLVVVKRGAGGGPRVKLPDADDAARYVSMVLQLQGVTVDDVFEARAMLEPAAVRRLADDATEEELGVLEAIHARNAALVEDPVEFAGVATEFHHALLELSSSRTVALIGKVLSEIMDAHHRKTMRVLDVERRKGAEDRTIRDHEALLQALRTHDGELASLLWARHLSNARHLAAESLGEHQVVQLAPDDELSLDGEDPGAR